MARGRKPRIIGNAPSAGEFPVIAGNDENGITGDTATAGDGTIIVEPRDIEPGSGSDSAAGSSEQPKRRGRKPGSKNSAKASALDISGVELLLYSTHNMLAALSKTPEIALSKEESNLLATAVVDVSKHYEFMSKVSAEAIAWTNLVQVAALIYGPRIVAFRASRKKATPADANNVYPIGGFNG